MQRLFSSFADGWPGKGLLIQRVLVATVVAYSLIADLSKAANFSAVLLQLVIAAGALLLLIGLWTPIAGGALALLEVWIIFSRTDNPWLPTILAVLSATLAMIGPGACSVDAHLFGRKHIEITNS